MSVTEPIFPEHCTIPFPLEPEQSTFRGRARSRSSRSVVLDPALIEHLGIEELATYARLALRHRSGEESNLRHLAAELWNGDLMQADTWVRSLAEKGLLEEADGWRARLRTELKAERVAAEVDRQALRDRVPVYLDGRWGGEWPIPPGHDVPADQVPTVYLAWDAASRVAYVGSSQWFTHRMRQHAEARRSEVWVRWEARECATRLDAYRLEAKEIDARKPYQNRPGIGPGQVGARGADFVRWAGGAR